MESISATVARSWPSCGMWVQGTIRWRGLPGSAQSKSRVGDGALLPGSFDPLRAEAPQKRQIWHLPPMHPLEEVERYWRRITSVVAGGELQASADPFGSGNICVPSVILESYAIFIHNLSISYVHGS